MRQLVILIALFFLAPRGNAALSPPYLFYKQFEAAFLTDPGIRIDKIEKHSEIKGMFVLWVSVSEDEKAKALASVFTKRPDLESESQIMIKVKDKSGKQVFGFDLSEENEIEKVKEVYSKALEDVPYFARFVQRPSALLYLLFKPVVVQYFADDIFKFDSLSTMVASDIFEQHLNPRRLVQFDIYVSSDTLEK